MNIPSLMSTNIHEMNFNRFDWLQDYESFEDFALKSKLNLHQNDVHFMGTTHVSEVSREELRRVQTELKPNVVLCEGSSEQLNLYQRFARSAEHMDGNDVVQKLVAEVTVRFVKFFDLTKCE